MSPQISCFSDIFIFLFLLFLIFLFINPVNSGTKFVTKLLH